MYGSLAETGKGHLTDQVIKESLGQNITEVVFNMDEIPEELNAHVNPLRFEALDSSNVHMLVFLIKLITTECSRCVYCMERGWRLRY